MRLLSTAPLSEASPVPQMEEFIGSQIPRYAILSHTWEAHEVTLHQLQTAAATAAATATATAPASVGAGGIGKAPLDLTATAGFRKIQQTCALARERDNLQYAWVDTCCIDKSSSAELTEAINSMFAWYRDAAVCYVYLSDLEPAGDDLGGVVVVQNQNEGGDEDRDGNLVRDLPRCRWFTRGWTLQELIAPREVLFFDREWNLRGSKKELAGLLGEITGIPETLLRCEAGVHDFAVARRMSWASRRETTRVEDTAYCLFGLFDVHMPLTYGEGTKAFERLQSAIVRETADLSILAWTDPRDASSCLAYAGALAQSPRQFAGCGNVESVPGDSAYANFAAITQGIQTEASLIYSDEYRVADDGYCAILDVYCNVEGKRLGICVRKIGGGRYARYKPHMILKLDLKVDYRLGRLAVQNLTLAPKLPRRFPFHPGLDPVLGNRYSALAVNWGRHRELWSYQTWPISHWDRHDRIFFSTNDSTKGWAVFFAEGKVRRGKSDSEHRRVHVRSLVACFDWNQGIPTVWVADWDDIDPVMAMLLESQLNHIKFESSVQAQTLVGSILRAKLDEQLIFKLNPQEVSYFGAHWRRQGETNSFRPVVTINLIRESRPDICTRPVLVLNIGINIDDPPKP